MLCNFDMAAFVSDSCGNDKYAINQANICGGYISAVLDDLGEAEIELTGKHDLMSRICLGRDYLKIVIDGVTEFHGPIVRLETQPFKVFARTPLWWTRKRVHVPGTGDDVYATPIQMFEGVILQGTNNPDMDPSFDGCEGEVCTPDFSPLCYPGGVWSLDGGEEAIGPNLNERQYHETLFNLLDDYAEAFLDFTEIGGELLYGYHQNPVPPNRQTARLVLTEESWCQKPRVVRDLEDFATDINVFTGAEDVGQTPFYPNGVYRKKVCCTKYGVHQRAVEHTELEGVSEIQDAANSYLPAFCDDRDITFIENNGLTELDPRLNTKIRYLVPGMFVDVNYHCKEDGVEINHTMRLIERLVEFKPDENSVKITLGPL